jgi:N,N'-diacetyllegionaminate synthase
MEIQNTKIEKIASGGEKQPVYIIAEMACAHDGQFVLAMQILEGAALAKADAVQFQIFDPDLFIHPDDPSYSLIKRLALPFEQWKELFLAARQYGLEVIVAAYDNNSISLARTMGADGYKIHSADLNNPILLRSIALSGKPMTVSVGGSSPDEIRSAIANIRSYGNPNIILMYGMQNFPTPYESVNLNRIPLLRELTGLPVGYQDHTDGDSPYAKWIPLLSLGLGARIIEKHMTHDRSKRGIDHQAALNPDEFVEFVDMTRTMETVFGKAGPEALSRLSDEDVKYRAYAKSRSIVSARGIKKGEVLKEEDVMVMMYRNGKMTPDMLPSILGKKALADIPVLHPISSEEIGAIA